MATYLQIPEPCSEKWSDMTPVSSGCRHCVACDRQIIDFTMKSDAEILEHLRRNTGKICGRFRATQMERPLLAAKSVKRGGLTAVAASFAAVLAAQQPAEGQKAEKFSIEYQSRTNLVDKTGLIRHPVNDTLRVLSGKVLDENGYELIGASIKLFAEDFVAGAISDLDGIFTLRLGPEKLKKYPLRIEISYLGYATKRIDIPEQIRYDDIALLTLHTKLDRDPDVHLTGGVGYYHYKPSIKSRIHHFFQKLF